MSARDIQVGVRITADGKGFTAEVKRGEQRLRDFSGATQQVDHAQKRLNNTFSTAHNRLINYAAAYIGIQTAMSAARGTIAATNQWTELNNKLRLVTDSEQNLIGVREDLFAVAQRTRNEFSATGTVFARLSKAAEASGRSQADMLRVTELLNMQVAIGGSNASEASAGLIQFAQGIASGRLQGDELRSVMENLLGVSDGLIIGFRKLREQGKIDFDVTRANIRDLAAEGVLGSELLLDAVLASADDTARKFAKVQINIAQASVQFGNALTNLIGELDNAAGASGGFAAALSDMAGWMGEIDSDALADDLRDIGDAAEVLAYLFGARLTLAAGKSAAAFALAQKEAVRYQLTLYRLRPAATKAAGAINFARVAVRGFAGALRFAAGPAGLVMLAAYSIYELVTASGAAAKSIAQTDGAVIDLTKSLTDFTKAQAAHEITKISKEVIQLENQLSDARKEHNELRNAWGAGYAHLPDARFPGAEAAAAQIDTLLQKIDDYNNRIAALRNVQEKSGAPEISKNLQRVLDDLKSEEQAMRDSYAAKLQLVDEGEAALGEKYSQVRQQLAAKQVADLAALEQRQQAERQRHLIAQYESEQVIVQNAKAKELLDADRHNATLIEKLRARGMMEASILQIVEDKRREKQEQELLDAQGYHSRREQQEAAHHKNLIAAQHQYNSEMANALSLAVDFETQQGAQKVQSGLEVLETMGAQNADYSKRAFKMQKAAGITQATISMYQGIAEAVKLGFPAAIVPMALAASTGAAQIRNIAAQQPPQQYNLGGVLEQPTFFTMPDGRTGKAADMGAEAIMPLKRMRDGRLGVAGDTANGKQVTVHIQTTVNVNAGDTPTETGAQAGQALVEVVEPVVRRVIAEEQRAGGQLNRANKI